MFITRVLSATVALTAALFLWLPAHVSGQVQTFKEVVGHEVGDRIVKSHQIVQYLNYLEEASDRVAVQKIGTTYNHKLQLVAIVTHPDNHARLGQIQENGKLLDDPRGITDQQAEEIIRDQPAILYLGGSIHGFELSGAEGLVKILEYYTTSNDEETLRELSNTVMVIDPIINADGRDAFAQYNHQHKGRKAHSDLADWSNDFTSWDGLKYRTSHYFFDLNRDWFAHTHPETRNRAAILRDWRPQAGVDAHEMGAEREFYVDPPTAPESPWFPPFTRTWFEEYGRAHAEGFDRENVEYTKREIFNYFYPSYFTSYLIYQGAVGMLYEQGSSRGFAWELSDGTVRTLADGAFNQYTAFRSMIGLSSDKREELLTDYYQANRESIELGSEGIVRYLIKPEGDPHLVAETVNLLMRSGIEVHKLRDGISLNNVVDRNGQSVGSHSFEEGTYLIEASQPRMRFIRKLMEPHIQIPEDFLEEARKRVDRSENPRFYDITSWSLPLMYNLQGFSTSDGRSVDAEMITEPVTAGGGAPERVAQYAYLIDGSQAALLSTVYPLRDAGIRLHIIYKPTRIDGKSYNSGTLVIRTDGNVEHVHEVVSELAEKYDLKVDAVDSGISEPGYPPLGTVEGNRVKKPKVAILGDYPIHGYSFGWAWHTLDRVYEIPHTVIRPTKIASTPMERFNVLIVPGILSVSELNRYLGDDGKERITKWVSDGGTLVTIGSATEYIRNELELTNLGSWYDEEENEDAQRLSVPGAFFHSELDPEEWLASGYSYDLPVMVNSSRLYMAPEGPPSAAQRTPVKISNSEDPRISGHSWEENTERLPGSVFLYEERIGSGRVIAFAEDVNFRGYWRGSDRLFLNAVILGPGAP